MSKNENFEQEQESNTLAANMIELCNRYLDCKAELWIMENGPLSKDFKELGLLDRKKGELYNIRHDIFDDICDVLQHVTATELIKKLDDEFKRNRSKYVKQIISKYEAKN